MNEKQIIEKVFQETREKNKWPHKPYRKRFRPFEEEMLKLTIKLCSEANRVVIDNLESDYRKLIDQYKKAINIIQNCDCPCHDTIQKTDLKELRQTLGGKA